MDLEAHFQSYRTSLRKGALEGSEDISRTTPTKSKDYPTAFDYLTAVMGNIRFAIDKKDHERYRHWLMQHQAAMVQLFEKMTTALLKEVDPHDEGAILDFLAAKGWRWFKFYDKSIDFTISLPDKDFPLRVVPRLESKFLNDCGGRAVFDADEFPIFKAVPSQEVAFRILGYKSENPKMKMIEPHTYITPEKVNQGEVRDWAAPLFLGELV